MTLTKNSIIEAIQTKCGYSIKESKELLEVIVEAIKGSLESGNNVKITGFGKWEVKQKQARPARNPHTGETIEIAARRVVSFYPSERLRKKVNSGKFGEE